MDKETSGSHSGAIVAGCVALLLLVYLLFPVVIVLPLYAAASRGLFPMHAVEMLTQPLDFIADRVPAYRRLIQKEVTFCRTMGLG